MTRQFKFPSHLMVSLCSALLCSASSPSLCRSRANHQCDRYDLDARSGLWA